MPQGTKIEPWDETFIKNGELHAYCPFDRNHEIRHAKMKYHILRCKASVKNFYKKCPYHEFHWIYKLDYD